MDVCFVHLYLADMDHFAAVNAAYRCYGGEGERGGGILKSTGKPLLVLDKRLSKTLMENSGFGDT